jgi:hypothetical protein
MLYFIRREEMKKTAVFAAVALVFIPMAAFSAFEAIEQGELVRQGSQSTGVPKKRYVRQNCSSGYIKKTYEQCSPKGTVCEVIDVCFAGHPQIWDIVSSVWKCEEGQAFDADTQLCFTEERPGWEVEDEIDDCLKRGDCPQKKLKALIRQDTKKEIASGKLVIPNPVWEAPAEKKPSRDTKQ